MPVMLVLMWLSVLLLLPPPPAHGSLQSTRHMGDDTLDITGLLTEPTGLRPHSPPMSNSTSALLFGGPGGNGDTAMDG